jgi:hypothetical protein
MAYHFESLVPKFIGTLILLTLAGCSSQLPFDPKEHEPFSVSGNGSIRVNVDIPDAKEITSVGLYPDTAYLEGSIGLVSYDEYLIDSRYDKFVRQQTLLKGQTRFNDIPSGAYYVIVWFTKDITKYHLRENGLPDESKLPKHPTDFIMEEFLETKIKELAEGKINTYTKTITITQNGIPRTYTRTFTKSDVVYETVPRKYGLAKKVTLVLGGDVKVDMSERDPSKTMILSVPESGFLGNQDIAAIKILLQ